MLGLKCGIFNCNHTFDNLNDFISHSFETFHPNNVMECLEDTCSYTGWNQRDLKRHLKRRHPNLNENSIRTKYKECHFSFCCFEPYSNESLFFL